MAKASNIVVNLVLLISLTGSGLLAGGLFPTNSEAALATIAISGTISGPGGVVAGVWVGVGSPQDWQETTSNTSGHYSLAIQTGGELWIHVRPDPTAGLAQLNMWMDGVTADLEQDFLLETGHLLDIGLVDPDYQLISEPAEIETWPLEYDLPGNRWFTLDWDENTHRYRAVLPADIYYLTARNLPSGYFQTSSSFDLRSGDLVAQMPLNTTYVQAIPYDPPDASKITISDIDGLGEAQVSGEAGAALPLSHVLLVNLNSFHQAHTISEADGSFSTKIFAPPGSAVMIKHGPPSWRWSDLDVGVSEMINPFPGTIINLAHAHQGDGDQIPFAAVGAVEASVDDPASTRNYVGSAWAITGTVGPVKVDGAWTRVLSSTYEGRSMPGLYLGGLNWTHPTLGDLDGDKDLELLIGAENNGLVLYTNQGDKTTPDWVFEEAGFAGVDGGWWTYPTLADVTNDGYPDLFVGTDEGKVHIYYNSGEGYPASPDTVLATGLRPAPVLVNLDADGDLDMLVGVVDYEDPPHSSLVHFKNTGTITTPLWTKESEVYAGISESGEWLQPAFIDLGGDSRPDLLVGLCGQAIWYERGGPTASPTWTRHGEDPIGYNGGSCASTFGIGDWSGDGFPDIVSGEHWGNLRLFRNDGPSTWLSQDYDLPFDLAGDSAPALADWDNDKDLDLLVGQAHGEIHQYTNMGNKTTPDWQHEGVLFALPWIDHPHPYPTLADIDGDGDVDLFVGEGGWQGPEAGGNIHFYRNEGDSSAPNWVLVSHYWLGLDVGGWSTPVFADIDADKDLDLFIGDEAGTITFVENVGTVMTPTWGSAVQPYAGLDFGERSAPSFFDLDLDSDLDMLVGVASGSFAYARNTGTPAEPEWELVSTTHPEFDIGYNATPASGDLNGDGDPDLLTGDGDGGLNLFIYDGPGNSEPPGTSLQPGDQLRMQGKVHLYSPAITVATDAAVVEADGWLGMLMLFNQDGKPMAAENYFMSTILAPTGFPIQRTERSAVPLDRHFAFGEFQYAGGHDLQAEFEINFQVPEDALPGIYRPVIYFEARNVPSDNQWLAANVTQYTYSAHEALLPPISVGEVGQPRLNWRLLMDDFYQGTRGTGAREDRGSLAISSQIVSQGASFYVPPIDEQTGQPLSYRLEPYLPMISFTDRRMPSPPLLPFDFSSSELCVSLQKPEGSGSNMGCQPFRQSFNRTKTTRMGQDLNIGTVQLDDVYSLMVDEASYRITFDQYGHHVITMTGSVDDLWGNTYQGGGTYDVWVAHPLDIDPGVLPGTPQAVGDAFNPAVQFTPRVPADVKISITHYPNSDPAQAVTLTVNGRANAYGYFSYGGSPIRFNDPGEVRVELTASYTDEDGKLYMGALTWGGVVMTPNNQAQLVAHGRRGLDSLGYIPFKWFVNSRDLNIPEGAISHSLNPYDNGDIYWSRMSDGPYGGDSLLLGASVHDTVGAIEAAVWERATSTHPGLSAPGDLQARFDNFEIPLFINTRSGQPAQFTLGKIGDQIPEEIDQIAYSYRSSQRPGVRVREVVAEDGQSGGYWRLDTLYDDQLGVGVLGDQPNDFKFQYVGAVYRDLESGHSEYLGQGSGWIFIPDSDPTGSRVMPPFAGPGNGGWTTEGGPLLTLKGEEIHIFILPTGVRPGAVLEVGDIFHFGGHIMPTLASQVAVTVTAPSGTSFLVSGQANSIGYFYDPQDDFAVNEAGLWSVDVRVWHDGQCSGGATIPPYPSGDVLGSDGGRYNFYVVPKGAPRLVVDSPPVGFLDFKNEVAPIILSGTLPAGLTDIEVDYTISMPGTILQHGQIDPIGPDYQITFDPVTLHDDFPNLDLVGRDEPRPGLADTIQISLLLMGKDGTSRVYRANTVSLQGNQVFVGSQDTYDNYLPVLVKRR